MMVLSLLTDAKRAHKEQQGIDAKVTKDARNTIKEGSAMFADSLSRTFALTRADDKRSRVSVQWSPIWQGSSSRKLM